MATPMIATMKRARHGCDTEIEYFVSGRQSAFDESRKNDDLECIRNGGQHHGGSKA